MSYRFYLPLTALIVLILFTILVHFQWLPPGLEMLHSLQGMFGAYFYVLIFVIILLESIVYMGFYIPGQFFAVLLVVLAKPAWQDIGYLTLVMVLAATLGSIINYWLGSRCGQRSDKSAGFSWRALLLAMIHINSLAFFMFQQGAKRRPFRVVWLAGLLNLPYYLLLIGLTSVLSEEILALAENNLVLIAVISLWLLVAGYLDWQDARDSLASRVAEAGEQ